MNASPQALNKRLLDHITRHRWRQFPSEFLKSYIMQLKISHLGRRHQVVPLRNTIEWEIFLNLQGRALGMK